jgi:PPOX class probable F420-dependent enzyme
LTAEEARRRFAAAPVARLATADSSGRPHIVPIVFAAEGDTILTAVDGKPKRSARLKRLDNIATNQNVSVLADEYTDDWSRLWWARADGIAEVLHRGSTRYEHGLDLLVDRYPQYQTQRPGGPVISISVYRWSGWVATP